MQLWSFKFRLFDCFLIHTLSKQLSRLYLDEIASLPQQLSVSEQMAQKNLGTIIKNWIVNQFLSNFQSQIIKKTGD